MADQKELPDKVSDLVEVLGVPVTPDDVDTYSKYRQAEDRSYRLRTVVAAWESQQAEERKLRRKYATAILIALCVQTALVDSAVLLIGLGVIVISPWVANVFVVSVFGQIVGLAVVVVRYLFPQAGSEILHLVEKV